MLSRKKRDRLRVYAFHSLIAVGIDCIAGNMREKCTLFGMLSKLEGWLEFALHSCAAIQLDGRYHTMIYVTAVRKLKVVPRVGIVIMSFL